MFGRGSRNYVWHMRNKRFYLIRDTALLSVKRQDALDRRQGLATFLVQFHSLKNKPLMGIEDFSLTFRHLTDFERLPWQIRPYSQFISDPVRGDPPSKDHGFIKAARLARQQPLPLDSEEISVNSRDDQTGPIQSVRSVQQCVFGKTNRPLPVYSCETALLETEE
jgi:hypothetical protein